MAQMKNKHGIAEEHLVRVKTGLHLSDVEEDLEELLELDRKSRLYHSPVAVDRGGRVSPHPTLDQLDKR